jgi:PAS domain S-box-containing protein
VLELADLHFIVFFFDLLLIFILLERNRKARLNIICAGVLGCGAFWSLCYGLIHRAPTPEVALLWINISALGWCSMPSGIYWFFMFFANRQDRIKGHVLKSLVGLPGLAFLVLQWTGNLITDVRQAPFGWIAFWPQSAASYVFFAYYVATIVAAAWLLILAMREATTNRYRQQARLLLITFPVTVVIGLTTDIILPMLHIAVLPQMADAALLFFDVGLVLAISRYGLMGVTPVAAYDEIMRTISDSLVMLNLQGRVVYANASTAAATGIRDESLIGRYFPDLTSNPTASKALQEGVFKDGREFRGEIAYRGANGQLLPVMVTLTPIRDRAQEILGLLVLGRDITETKKAEAQALSYRDLIDAILNALPEAVLQLGKEHRIEFANNAACEMLGAPRLDCEGQQLERRLPVPALSRAVWEVLQGNLPQANLEFRSGPARQERIYKASIITMGSERCLAILRDITGDREREGQLYLTDRLASVGEMAAGIAHELNNPLTSVVGLAETLKNEDLDAELKEDVATISREAQRAAAIIRNLLTFARHHAVTRQPVQLNTALEEIIRLRAYENRVHNIDVVKEFAPSLPEVSGDYFQLQQVFINIILNAEHAITGGDKRGRLVIITRQRDDMVRVSFADNGPGITAADMPRIFDPFYTTKEVGQGTGLGLSISYGIVTEHGGRIWAENQKGGGAIFHVELPAAPSAA